MFSQVLLSTLFWSHISSAEYVINFVTTDSYPNTNNKGLETVILTDDFQGCVPLPSAVSSWYKPNFDNLRLFRYLQGFSSNDCSGAGVGTAQSYPFPEPNRLQTFTGDNVKSVKITFPNSQKRDATPEAEDAIYEFILGPNRELINATTQSDLAIARRGLDGYNLVLNGDRLFNRLTSGLFATWQYGNIEHGHDLSSPVFSSNPDLWASWARQIGTSWSTDNPSGITPHLEGNLYSGSSHLAGWYIELNGNHRTSDITSATLTSAVWRAMEYANANGDTWIKFDILNWNGSDNIATVTLWMEGSD
ncbi:hypothetical protein NQ176_g7357 [Zarea fungicola]|uniref:Uncharacterized protein n=1 Tax=Zarea fungicola TaxID=93591 RepID=A0ACC1MZW3_9HYPO|nr:hypothetical protein NQ176_g7357 [Lecanicillium fungicola]